MCRVFDDPADFRAQAVEFLADGLARGCRVRYLGEGDVDTLRAEVAPLLQRAHRPGAAQVLSMAGMHTASRGVDAATHVAMYAADTQAALADGFAGLRVAADSTGLVRTPEQLDAFARYDRVGRGRAHLYAGTALALSGAPDPARAEFAQARTLLTECGAHLFVAQVDREERRMNARGPRHDAAGTTAPEQLLTPRELHVARLVTQGMTNRQIAQELFLSPKTVDVYLTRIYAKLGVPRRAALAELLTRAKANGHDN